MSSGSPAAEHVLAVLDFLSHGKGPVPAATISRTLGIPRSTTYQLLEALSARGFATHFPDDRTWGLGVRAGLMQVKGTPKVANPEGWLEGCSSCLTLIQVSSVATLSLSR